MNAHIHIIKHDIGTCVGFDGTLSHSLQFAAANGMGSCQVFMGDQISLSRAKIGTKDILECQKIQKRFPIHFFSHFPFTASLCGSVNELAWNGNETQDRKTSFMLNQLEYELDVFANFSLKNCSGGVVIHPGCNSDTGGGLSSIAKSINRIKFTPHGKLILENSAGEGRKLCKNFEELSAIFAKIDPQQREHVGVCIDTAHIHGQGDFDLSNTNGVDDMFSAFQNLIGFDHLSLVHLNDSEVKIGSKKDRHACLTTGEIWRKRDNALRHLIERCTLLNTPMVMETDMCDMVTVSRLMSDK